MSTFPPPIGPRPVGFDLVCIKCRYNLRGCPSDAPCPECSTPIVDSLAAVGQMGELGPTVDLDRACVRCSYNLRGLPTSGKCPECGLSVEQSLRGFLLQFAAPEYLGNLLSGLSLVLNGILLQIILSVVGIFLGVAAGALGAGGNAAVIKLLIALASIVPSIMILLGYWKYTQPDPGFVGTEVPISARKYIRVAVVIQAIAAALSFLFQIGAYGGAFAVGGSGLTMVLGFITIAIGLASAIAWLLQFFANMRYTRWLASRVPDSWIVQRTRTYTWLLPLIAILGAIVLMIGPLIALVLYWNLLDRMRKHLKSIRAAGVPASL